MDYENLEQLSPDVTLDNHQEEKIQFNQPQKFEVHQSNEKQHARKTSNQLIVLKKDQINKKPPLVLTQELMANKIKQRALDHATGPNVGRVSVNEESLTYQYEVTDIQFYEHNGKKKKKIKKKKKKISTIESSKWEGDTIYSQMPSPMSTNSKQQPIKLRIDKIESLRTIQQDDYQQDPMGLYHQNPLAKELIPEVRSQRSVSVLNTSRNQVRLMGQVNTTNKENSIADSTREKPTVRQIKAQLQKDSVMNIGVVNQVLPQLSNQDDFQMAVDIAGGEYPIHRLLLKKEFGNLVRFFNLGIFTEEHINQKDNKGNTPLILTGKLSQLDDDYLRAVNFLFKQNANGKLRDKNGWSLMDEAISQQNTRLLAIVFDHLNAKKKEKWNSHTRLNIVKKLKSIPDFYIELHWECQSSWIPFLSKIAPNDTYQIWKVGSQIRLDFSLVGFSKLHVKRRRMSIIFRDKDEIDKKTGDQVGNMDIVLLNKDRQIIVNPLEDLDLEEKLLILTDMINADPIQNELNISEQEWKECKSIFGNIQTETINGYQCNKYKVIVKCQMKTQKKIKFVKMKQLTPEEYFKNDDLDNDNVEVSKVAKDVKKTIESSLWLSKDFPLDVKSFLTVLKTLSMGGNTTMQKIREFMKNESLKSVVNSHGFPVKIQIPIGLIVKATVTFNKFRYLNQNNENLTEIFAIPSNCKYVQRKDGMKTLQNKKKRLAFANIAT